MSTTSPPPTIPAVRWPRRIGMALLPLAPCAGIAAVTSTTPTGFAVRFVVLAGVLLLGVWCAVVWGVTFAVLGDDQPHA